MDISVAMLTDFNNIWNINCPVFSRIALETELKSPSGLVDNGVVTTAGSFNSQERNLTFRPHP